jgi:hypothetical protein
MYQGERQAGMQGMKELNLVYPVRSTSTGISLRDLAAPLFRRRQLLLATFLIALVAGVAAGFLNPARYTSTLGSHRHFAGHDSVGE